MNPEIRKLSDDELIRRLHALVKREREALSELLMHLAEFDYRRLHAKGKYPSLYHYCTEEFGYSEAAAYTRIFTARTAFRFPMIFDLLKDGSIHMRAVGILGPHLTEANHRELLAMARGKKRIELEAIAAAYAPKSISADFIQRRPPQKPAVAMPGAPPSGEAGAMLPVPRPGPSIIQPLAPDRVRFGFTGDNSLLSLLARARSLLRRKFPKGGLEDIFREALNALLDRLDPDRRKPVQPGRRDPEKRSRSIPPSVKDAVWRRDGGRCTFLDAAGERCAERGILEFDHIKPWSLGGRSDDPDNMRLLCRAHNQLAARRVFGEAAPQVGRRGTNSGPRA